MDDYDFYDNKQRLVGNENFKESIFGRKKVYHLGLKHQIFKDISWGSTTGSSKIILYKEGV